MPTKSKKPSPTPTAAGCRAAASCSALVEGQTYFYAFADGPQAVLFHGVRDINGLQVPFFDHAYKGSLVRRYLDPAHAHETMEGALIAVRENEKIRRALMDRLLGQNAQAEPQQQ